MSVILDDDEYARLIKAAGEDKPTKQPCVSHHWIFVGGRNAGCKEDCECSVPVHQCTVCGDSDYGDNEEAQDIVRLCKEITDAALRDGSIS